MLEQLLTNLTWEPARSGPPFNQNITHVEAGQDLRIRADRREGVGVHHHRQRIAGKLLQDVQLLAVENRYDWRAGAGRQAVG